MFQIHEKLQMQDVWITSTKKAHKKLYMFYF